MHGTSKYRVRQITERHHRGKHQFQEGKVTEIDPGSDAECHRFRHFYTIKIKKIRGGATFAMARLAVCIIDQYGIAHYV